MNRPCDISFLCGGETDNPIANLSSEAIDGVSFRAVRFARWHNRNPFGYDPNNRGNPPPVWFANGCVGQCLSLISLEDAQRCADRQAYLCVMGNQPTCLENCYTLYHGTGAPLVNCFDKCLPPLTCPDHCFDSIQAKCLQPDGTLNEQCLNANQSEVNTCIEKCFKSAAPVYNTEQTCSFPCPDGTETSATVKAGEVVGMTQEEANLVAYTQACALAAQQGCAGVNPGPTPPGPPAHGCDITTGDSLPDAAVGSFYTVQLTYSGQMFNANWSITSGALPDGLTLDAGSGVISGIPTQANTGSLFTVALSNLEDSCSKTFTIIVNDNTCIVENTLPDGHVCDFYHTTFTPSDAAIKAAQAYADENCGGLYKWTWSVGSGSLPDGVIMDMDGGVAGRPTSKGTFTFTVCLGVECAGGGS